MTDLQAVLETMAMAMATTMEEASVTGRSFVVSFTVEGGTGRIAAVREESPFLWEGAMLPDGRTIGKYYP